MFEKNIRLMVILTMSNFCHGTLFQNNRGFFKAEIIGFVKIQSSRCVYLMKLTVISIL